VAAPGKDQTSGSKKVFDFVRDFEDLEEFYNRLGADVSYGGIFIRSQDISPDGTIFNLKLKTKDGQEIIEGMGQVVWTRDPDPYDESIVAGMGVKYININSSSAKIINDIVLRASKEGRRSKEIRGLEENRFFQVDSFQSLLNMAAVGEGLDVRDSYEREPEPEDREFDSEATLELKEEPTSFGREPGAKRKDEGDILEGTTILTPGAAPSKIKPDKKPEKSIIYRAAKTSRNLLFTEIVKEKAPISRSREIATAICALVAIIFLFVSLSLISSQEKMQVREWRQNIKEKTILKITPEPGEEEPTLDEMILKFEGTKFVIVTEDKMSAPVQAKPGASPAATTARDSELIGARAAEDLAAVPGETVAAIEPEAGGDITTGTPGIKAATSISQIRIKFTGRKSYIYFIADGKISDYRIAEDLEAGNVLNIFFDNLPVKIAYEEIPVNRNNIVSVNLDQVEDSLNVKVFFSSQSIPEHVLKELTNGLVLEMNY
jgi:hypothetical protein